MGMQRIVVIGTSGSGKSTLAEALADRINAKFIDMDALYWQPNWEATPDEVFRAKLAEATAQPCWTISGNYSRTRDLTWACADTLIWLDYSFPLVFSRLFRRTIRRIRSQEDLWNTGNRETWRKAFFDRKSIFLWAIQTHGKYRQNINQALQQPEYTHLRFIRFQTPRQADAWLKAVEQTHESGA
jgi:adenylate kinase family enzyme